MIGSFLWETAFTAVLLACSAAVMVGAVCVWLLVIDRIRGLR